MQDDPQEDGYVECSECGHTLEAHNTTGCKICDCDAYWSPQEIERAYRAAGVVPQASLSYACYERD